MGESPCNCDDPEIIVILDRELDEPYVSGNAYGRYCTNCGRRYFCKPEFWKAADERYVIPRGEDEPIHVENFDGDEYENFFECPNEGCGEPLFGEPNECPECGASYNWN